MSILCSTHSILSSNVMFGSFPFCRTFNSVMLLSEGLRLLADVLFRRQHETILWFRNIQKLGNWMIEKPRNRPIYPPTFPTRLDIPNARICFISLIPASSKITKKLVTLLVPYFFDINSGSLVGISLRSIS